MSSIKIGETVNGTNEHYNDKAAVKKILSSFKIDETVNETNKHYNKKVTVRKKNKISRI